MAATTRLFALIIGIDRYKSGSIWDLHSCVDDAENVRNWLTDALGVPKTHIRMLLDEKATKRNIEDAFMDHLVNNTSIEHGDAMVIYFAGHGSSIPAPRDWYGSGVSSPSNVPVLCPYDHDTKSGSGRISGISDRSLLALMDDLAAAKGDNITLLLDTCFKPPKSNEGDRRFTRHTETRANGDDLYRDMWLTARGRTPSTKGVLFKPSPSFVLMTASPVGSAAVEDKEGGKFTSTLLRAVSDLPLHHTSYSSLHVRTLQLVGGMQRFMCIGKNTNRILFDGIPFTPDPRYFPATLHHSRNVLYVDMGSIHGVVQGTELTVHLHNLNHSTNPTLASAVVVDVEGSWSVAQVRTTGIDIPKACWVRVSHWNNQPPFYVKLRTTFTSFFRCWSLRKSLPCEAGDPPLGRFNILRVRKSEDADISVTVHRERVEVRQHSMPRQEGAAPVVNIPSRSAAEVIDNAARFQLHLQQNNGDKPLNDLVQMELYRLHPTSWSRLTRNLFNDKNTVIPYRPGDIYQLSLQNRSSVDLWPYVVFMDPTSYQSTILYQPDRKSKTPPLRAGGRLDIGSDKSAPQALSFALADAKPYNAAFLKLFLSSKPVEMDHLTHVAAHSSAATSPDPADVLNKPGPSKVGKSRSHIWDTNLAMITISPPVSSTLGSARAY